MERGEEEEGEVGALTANAVNISTISPYSAGVKSSLRISVWRE